MTQTKPRSISAAPTSYQIGGRSIERLPEAEDVHCDVVELAGAAVDLFEAYRLKDWIKGDAARRLGFVLFDLQARLQDTLAAFEALSEKENRQ